MWSNIVLCLKFQRTSLAVQKKKKKKNANVICVKYYTDILGISTEREKKCKLEYSYFSGKNLVNIKITWHMRHTRKSYTHFGKTVVKYEHFFLSGITF